MPSKKRKYNARFPAGRIKKIMQTDEEVGKVAQAVPIIISRTLELFVESLLQKAFQVTSARNAKTLSPSHVKQCVLAEQRFDFLKDLVKNIPDVSAAEEKEMMSAESSPNSSRFSDVSIPPRRVVREDSNSSSSCDVRIVPPQPAAPPVAQPVGQPVVQPVAPPISQHTRDRLKSVLAHEAKSTTAAVDMAIDLSKKPEERPRPVPNFYQETLVTEETQHQSVITVNPTYATPQPSTSYVPRPEPLQRIETVPKLDRKNSLPRTPVTPIINIDFSKNPAIPEIKVLDLVSVPDRTKLIRQNSKVKEVKKIDLKTNEDGWNAGNLQIDEDYDT